MSSDEFSDWLLFESPNAEEFFKIYDLLRYSTQTAQDDFINHTHKSYMEK